jgi:hypothetical protein
VGRLRQAQKLLRLAERYGPEWINAACARALAFELLDVGRVEAIVRTALERAPADGAGARPAALPERPRVSPTRPSPYDVLVERHRRAAAIITSNRAVDE